MSKKFFAAVFLFVLLSAVTASAEVVGRFTVINSSTQDAATIMTKHFEDYSEVYIGIDINNISVKFYDSLNTMLLALNKGEIDSITVPRPVGRYVIENNKNFNVKGFNYWDSLDSSTLNFGLMDAKLAKKFNEAIAGIKQDGTLAMLTDKYIENFETPASETFEKFDDAETITVAVTGDLPPIDYVDASGTPAGFNVAVLKEIAKRLHVNIKTISIDSGSRIAALTSGRADVIFWLRGDRYKHEVTIADKINSTIILSEPYYFWNEQYFICKRKK